MVFKMIQFDLVSFFFDDFIEMIHNCIFVACIDNKPHKFFFFGITGDSIVDDTSFLVQEEGQIALSHSFFACS